MVAEEPATDIDRGFNGNRLKPMSVIAELASLPLPEVYRRFRLPSAPRPAAYVAQVAHWDTDKALDYLRPSAPG